MGSAPYAPFAREPRIAWSVVGLYPVRPSCELASSTTNVCSAGEYRLISSPQRVKISPGAQTGQQYRLKSRGMTVLRSNTRGDMYIQIAVETPVSLTKKQQELLREFESAGKSGKTSPQSEGFFTKVKEFWEDLTE